MFYPAGEAAPRQSHTFKQRRQTASTAVAAAAAAISTAACHTSTFLPRGERSALVSVVPRATAGSTARWHGVATVAVVVLVGQSTGVGVAVVSVVRGRGKKNTGQEAREGRRTEEETVRVYRMYSTDVLY